MKSLLELISQHSDANAIIPILAIISIVVTIILYIVLKPRWIKYVANLLVVVIGAVVFINGYIKIIDDRGLSLLLLGTKILAFGIIGILFSAILDILDSLFKNLKKNKKEQKEQKKEIKENESGNVIKKEEKSEIENIDSNTKKLNLDTVKTSKNDNNKDTVILNKDLEDYDSIKSVDETKVINKEEINKKLKQRNN